MIRQFNSQKIQFRIRDLFALTLNVKQFYLTHRLDTIRCYHSWPEWTWTQWQWRSTLHSIEHQHYWNLTIRLFNFISRTLVGKGEFYPSAKMLSVYSTAPADWAYDTRVNQIFCYISVHDSLRCIYHNKQFKWLLVHCVVHCFTLCVIWKLHGWMCKIVVIFYEFGLGHNFAEATKTIYGAKGESSVNHTTVTRYLKKFGGARGIMVIVVGNGYDDTGSNPGWDWLHFT